MPVGGIASDILVKDGEDVKAGQVVMRLDAERISNGSTPFKKIRN